MNGYSILGFEKVNDVEEIKVVEIAESIKANGWIGCPILTYGNVLIAGSHRLAALQRLNEEDFNIDFECAVDVSDIIEEKIDNGEELADIFNNLDRLQLIFEGTWVEEYKNQLAEW